MRPKLRTVITAATAAVVAGPAFAQDTAPPPPPPPPNPLPVPTPNPQPGESKLDVKQKEPLIPFFTGWKGGVEVGINGSEGNSENFNFYAGVNAERKTDRYDTKASFIYLRASSDGQVNKNRAELDLRNDWIFAKGSPWRYFLQGSVEYDDFQDWQYRITVMNGIGYAFIENEKTTLIGRAGFGLRDDLLGSDNPIHPEGLLGLAWSYKISERQQITAPAEYSPDFLDPPRYRA